MRFYLKYIYANTKTYLWWNHEKRRGIKWTKWDNVFLATMQTTRTSFASRLHYVAPEMQCLCCQNSASVICILSIRCIVITEAIVFVLESNCSAWHCILDAYHVLKRLIDMDFFLSMSYHSITTHSHDKHILVKKVWYQWQQIIVRL